MSIRKPINTFAHNLIEWIVERLPAIIHREHGGSFNYLAAILLMGIALWVRITIAPISAGLQYITFFPAVTLAAVIGGIWPGLFATVIGMALANVHTVAPTSYGIRGMRERVAQLGGKIDFDRSPGGGFRVKVILPLPAGNEQQKGAEP